MNRQKLLLIVSFFLLNFYVSACQKDDEPDTPTVIDDDNNGTDPEPIKPLPRIGTRPGVQFAEFYNTETGEQFKPIGSSYVRLHQAGDAVSHANFAESLYDSERARDALQIMAESGYTVVRVWCYHGHPNLWPIRSIEGPTETDTPKLYQPYIDNLIDFLEIATMNGIYVQLAIDRTPRNAFYDDLVNSGYPHVTGFINREYMVSGAITAKEIYIKELIQSIIDHDSDLLNTIFAYEIRNEIHSRSDNGPFSNAAGMVTTAAGIYDMGSPESRQACQDDNVSLYLNSSVAAIREKDPNALATTSIFTFSPVGKAGMAGNGLLPINTPDRRWPIRPAILLDTDLDFVSIHGYIPSDWDNSLESSEWSSINKAKKPFMCGEFGAHRNAFPNVYNAAEALFSYREDILDAGFRGALLFTWDTYIHTRWTMMEDDKIINERLKPNAWASWVFDRDGFTRFWEPGHNVTDLNVTDGILHLNIAGSNPYILSPTSRIDADSYKYLEISMKNMTLGHEANIYWITKEDNTWSEAKSLKFAIDRNANDFKTYRIDLGNHPNWSDIIKQIRFYPVSKTVNPGSYGIRSIEFLKQ